MRTMFTLEWLCNSESLVKNHQNVDRFCGTWRKHLVNTEHFFQKGPDGSHLRLADGRVSGSRRLRGDLAKRKAKKVATAVELLHSARGGSSLNHADEPVLR